MIHGNLYRAFCLLLAAAPLGGCAKRAGLPHPDPSIEERSFQSIARSVTRQIREQLDAGWRAKHDADKIIMERQRAVVFYSGVSMRPKSHSENERAYLLEHGEEGRLSIVLRVGQKLSFEEYGTWLRQRRDRVLALRQSRAGLSDIPVGKGSPMPRNAREKERVARYYRSVYQLATEARPVFFVSDATLYLYGMLWNRGVDKMWLLDVFPEHALEEARSILRHLHEAFPHYSEASDVQWHVPYGVPSLLSLPLECDDTLPGNGAPDPGVEADPGA